MTQEYKGKSVYKGIALGPVVVFQKNDVQVKREKITDAEGEIARMPVSYTHLDVYKRQLSAISSG